MKLLPLLVLVVALPLSAAEPMTANVWKKVAPPIAGQRWDIPLGVVGPGGPLLVLGGRTSWAEYKKLRPYDVLAWDAANSAWENQFPLGNLPEADAVLLGARVAVEDKLHWLIYDCADNAWRGIELPGDDPIGKGTAGRTFNNSMGLMYDPNRKLIWAVGQYSHVHVLRLDNSASRPLR